MSRKEDVNRGRFEVKSEVFLTIINFTIFELHQEKMSSKSLNLQVQFPRVIWATAIGQRSRASYCGVYLCVCCRGIKHVETQGYFRSPDF